MELEAHPLKGTLPGQPLDTQQLVPCPVRQFRRSLGPIQAHHLANQKHGVDLIIERVGADDASVP